jgi:MoaD family protein
MAVDVRLRFYTHLRDVVGQKTIHRTYADGATVRDVLEELVEEYPDLAEYVFDEDGEIRTTLVVRKDNANAHGDDAVADGDDIGLTTQVVGGSSDRLPSARPGE